MGSAALFGGVPVRCVCERPDVLEAFAALGLADAPAGERPLEYRIEPGPLSIWILRGPEGVLATSPYAGNLVALLELHVAGAVERDRPGSIWFHAACVARPDGSALVLAGPSGIGKSTAAVSFGAAGWRYLTDEAVLLDPATREVVGLGSAIRLEGDVSPPPGFGATREIWRPAEGAPLVASRLRPPEVWDARQAARLEAIVILERGPARLRTLSPGEALVRLWPRRIARRDGKEPWSPADFAAALAGVPVAIARTERPAELLPLVDRWLGSPSRGS